MGLPRFSYFPLQVATYFGFAAALLAVLGILVTIILRLSGSHAFFGQATTLVSVLFLGGVQLICLGILGEYLGRIYDEVKGRPLYIVREALGFEESRVSVGVWENALIALRTPTLPTPTPITLPVSCLTLPIVKRPAGCLLAQ